MNPIYTATRLANLILALHARNRNFMEHFQPATQRELREAIRDHEDALVQRQVEDAALKTKRLCPPCDGSGQVRDGDYVQHECLRCLGTGWEDL